MNDSDGHKPVPETDNPPGETRPERISLSRGPRPARILLSDDEPCVRDAIMLVIEFFFTGYVITDCSTGDEAWSELSKSEPDLLITDFNHPGLSLEEMLRLLSRKGTRFPVAVLSMTLASFPDVQQRILSLPGLTITIVHKPFLPAELKTCIINCLTPASDHHPTYRVLH